MAAAPYGPLSPARVWHGALPRQLRGAVLVNRQPPAKPRARIWASPELAVDGRKVVELYPARFQLEFRWRARNPVTGLADGQARAQAALDLQCQASRATRHLARADEGLAAPDQSPQVFSRARGKQRKFNERVRD